MRTKIQLINKDDMILAKAYAMMGSSLAACLLADDSPHLKEGEPIEELDRRLVLLYKVNYKDGYTYIGPRILKGDGIVAYIESSKDVLTLREIKKPEFVDFTMKEITIPSQGYLRTCVFRDPERGPIDWIINLETGMVERVVTRWKNI